MRIPSSNDAEECSDKLRILRLAVIGLGVRIKSTGIDINDWRKEDIANVHRMLTRLCDGEGDPLDEISHALTLVDALNEDIDDEFRRTNMG